MLNNSKLLKYFSPLIINLAMAYPFIHFLVSPENASSKIIASVYYIILLKMVSFFIITELIFYKQEKKIRVLNLMVPALILWMFFDETSAVLVYYFLGGIFVDAITIYRTKTKEIISITTAGLARILLFLILLAPAGLVGWLIHDKYTHAVLLKSNVYTSANDVEGLISITILLILYYIFEPFAQPAFNMTFDSNPTSRLGKLLNKKIW